MTARSLPCFPLYLDGLTLSLESSSHFPPLSPLTYLQCHDVPFCHNHNSGIATPVIAQSCPSLTLSRKTNRSFNDRMVRHNNYRLTWARCCPWQLLDPARLVKSLV